MSHGRCAKAASDYSLRGSINRIHVKALKSTQMEKTLSFDELTNKGKTVIIHGRNRQAPATKLFKSRKKNFTRNYDKNY